jgi:Raf kinase inhibitor-like YbhB/YbcL family protein
MLKFVSFLLCIFLSATAYADKMLLSSKAFANDNTIPALYTCDGKDISPDLKWSNLPNKTRSLSIILSDEDAPNGIFYHWVVFNLQSKTNVLGEGITTLPLGTSIGKNSWGRSQYNGPCPPKSALHHYNLTLYALDEKISVPPDASALTLLSSMQGHILGQATLKMMYSRLTK